MTNAETASLLTVFHGAYPSVFVDEAVADVWANSMSRTPFQPAHEAALQWVGTMTRWPTIAEFNSEVRRIRGRDERQITTHTAVPDVAAAKAAFQAGLRSALQQAGADDEEIERKANQYLTDWPAVNVGRAS